MGLQADPGEAMGPGTGDDGRELVGVGRITADERQLLAFDPARRQLLVEIVWLRRVDASLGAEATGVGAQPGDGKGRSTGTHGAETETPPSARAEGGESMLEWLRRDWPRDWPRD